MLFEFVLPLIFLGVIAIVIIAVWPNKMKVEKEALVIGGLFTSKVLLSDIKGVELVRKIPERRRLGGSDTGDVQKGYFEIKGMGKAYLNIRVSSPPYILINARSGRLLVINKFSEHETTALYEDLIQNANRA